MSYNNRSTYSSGRGDSRSQHQPRDQQYGNHNRYSNGARDYYQNNQQRSYYGNDRFGSQNNQQTNYHGNQGPQRSHYGGRNDRAGNWKAGEHRSNDRGSDSVHQRDSASAEMHRDESRSDPVNPPKKARHGNSSDDEISSEILREVNTIKRVPLTSDQEKFKERLKSLYQFPDNVSQLPHQAFNNPDIPEWVEKKKKAVDSALKAIQIEYDKTNRRNEEECLTSDPDSSPDVYGEEPTSHRTIPKLTVEGDITKFFNAIPTCYPLCTGFDVIAFAHNDDRHCYCPCGRAMKKWREKAEVDKILEGHECDMNINDPSALLTHLRKMGGVFEEKESGTKRKVTREMSCPYHYGIRVYLETLYSDYRNGVGHKALYGYNTREFKKADAAEKRALKRQIDLGNMVIAQQDQQIRELNDEKEKYEKEMEKLKELSDDQHKKILALNEERQKLGVTKKVSTKISADTVDHFRRCFQAFRRAVKVGLQGPKLNLKLNYCPDETRICDIQELLDKVYDGSKSSNLWKAFFAEKVNPEHLLLEWNIVFENKELRGKTKKEITAIDEGGPSRQFISEFLKQFSGLHITAAEKNICLFESSPGGPIPSTDEKLRHKVKYALKAASQCCDKSEVDGFVKRAECYYFAIGRIILHSILTDITLSSSAMVPLYQNFLLRGCSPADKEYHKDDILKHVNGLLPNLEQTISWAVGQPYEFADGVEEVLDKETVFTKLIPHLCMESRRISLDALKNGLTLKTKKDDKSEELVPLLELKDVFRPMPLEVIQKLIFSCPTLTADDVINAIVPRYDAGCSKWEGTEEDRAEAKKRQEIFFEQMFKPFLQARESSEKDAIDGPRFLEKFVECCTGLNYLPFLDGKPENMITVEFNYEDQMPGSLPRFHTCTKEMVLPGHIYETYDEFAEKMEKSIDLCFGKFDMN